jgi:hypothetical protein
LALLYGIGAEFLSDDEFGGWRYWPAYASTLVFKLVRIDEANSDQSHVVRILLDGKPIKSVNQHHRFWEGGSPAMGNGPLEMLSAHDFLEVVARLEQAGGYHRQNIESEDSSIKRDMSNWTGWEIYHS